MGFNKQSIKKYTRTYSYFLGVDRDGVGSEINARRLAYSENVYRDYSGEGGVIESVPGYRRLARLGKKINGLFIQKGDSADYLIIHSGDSIYRISTDLIDEMEPKKIGEAADRRSSAFSYYGELFLLDGERIHNVNKYGEHRIIDKDDYSLYVPITYVGGERCETRNLFTDKFIEQMPISDPYEFLEETDGLIYEVSDEGLGHCTVAGAEGSIEGTLNIPKYKVIAGVKYSVYSIADDAFSGQSGIVHLKIAQGVRYIGNRAFFGCDGLKTVRIPKTVMEIGDMAFKACLNLEEVRLGGGCERIGDGAFSLTALKNVYFGGTEAQFLSLEGASQAFANVETEVDVPDLPSSIKVPIYSDVLTVDRVTLDEEEIPYDIEENGEKTFAVILWEYGDEFKPRMLEVRGSQKEFRSYFRKEGYGFYPEVDGWGREGFASVSSAKICEMFDGRIFYAGCDSLPGVVFYSERTRTGQNDPLYVGAYSYFRDGFYETASLLSVRDRLAHFKKGDSGEGSIFYHVPMETGDPVMPKIYPVSSVHSGVSSSGGAVSFYDDPVFLTSHGLSALRMTNIEYERSVDCVSHNVNSDLLAEDLSSSSLAIWEGYLAIATRGNIYLADSRAKFRHMTGVYEYEWFIMKGVGTWDGDYRVYRYSSAPHAGYALHPSPDSMADDVIYSEITDGTLIHFTEESGVKYEVYPTDELTGGTFDPAIMLVSSEELLFFGTEGGDLCVFNNDKRGIPPDRIKEMDDFSPQEYSESMGRAIHPDFYSFMGHSPRYAIKTKLDNCDVPHMTKDTVKGSLVIRCKSSSGSKLHVEVGTDRKGYGEIAYFPTHSMDFSSLSFSDISLDTGTYISIPISERERGWCEKQIAVYSDEYASPLAISSISYRYTLNGKIKKR